MKKSKKKSKRRSKERSAKKSAPNRRIASIDVGSNGIRLLVCEIQKNSQLKIIFGTRAGVRLGRDVFRDGYIREPTARKALRAFLKFKKIMKRLKVKTYKAVATSAVRDSHNGRDFIKYIKKFSGLDIEVINGQREGRLIHTAVSSKINLMNALALLVDIGGGSVELTVSRFGKVQAVKTFPLGTVRMINQTDMYLGESKAKVVENILNSKSLPLKKFLKSHFQNARNFILIGTGGNIEALGNLRMKYLGKNSNSRLSLAELRTAVNLICKYSYDERISKLDMRPDRADVIIPGALALLLVMKLSRAREVFVPQVGLKDGVMIDLARKFSMR